ncbi:ribosome small subunit-dependent GTPase A [Tychonema sp. LEGE 07203]|uniref:ribosome small subunit-dependent GTPase A n=1 Tax=Tychonema sp. LEGE 07203 TaxID=1828671 RepID=UPI00187F5FA4|nr:ribosome small subunit-dependent GTPase A [Tychonema sp. LEGE 07203]MBE9095776.1 ribosome small subunit-dependent GTPase A [Tychonema sp. LEGE 07203]
MSLNSSSIVGTVVAVQANFYRVRLDPAAGIHENIALADAPTLLCTRRTRLKKINQQVMVGDRVVVDEPDWTDRRGAISKVFDRHTELNRPPVANADRILLVFALAEPDLDPASLTRFLVKAESTGLEVNLCLNKCDLVSPQELEQWRDRLSGWGYEPMFISVRTGLGVQEVTTNFQNKVSVTKVPGQHLLDKRDGSLLPDRDNLQIINYVDPLEPLNSLQNLGQNLQEDQIREKITIICGPSGVGKSSLINQLIPALNLRVNAVSGKLGRGRHTTRHVELFELPGGGLLADTPGFNQPTLECDPSELAEYFPEARQRLALGSCQFSDCSHRGEPNCVVRGSWERYEYYLSFLEEAIVRQQALQNSSSAESSLKQQTKSDGTQQYEPKLQTKKYRRMNRRLQHQSLQDMCQDLDQL